MMRLLRSVLLVAALVAAGVRAAVRLRLSQRSLPTAPGAIAAERQARAKGVDMQRWGVRIAALLAVLAVGGMLVVVSGLVPIKASSGHWRITSWLLHFAMRRSVATHSLGLQVPALDAPRLVLQGAGHYETGCRPCHGSPGLPQPRIAQQMTPHPPYLPPRISAWQPDELFYIVKHGVKFTGMPAWPAQQRDDEVWAMVAFLLLLPDLDAEAYRRLVHGESPGTSADVPIQGLLGPQKEPRAVTENCARCHGVDGRGRGQGAFPRLAGQRPTYLYAALQAYAHGERQSGIMAPVAAALHPDEMRELALYYASLQAPIAAAASPGHHAGHRTRQGDRSPRHPTSTCPLLCRLSRPWCSPPESVLSRARRPVRRLSRRATRTLQAGAARWFSLCPPHASGGQPG